VGDDAPVTDAWTTDELGRIAGAEELELAPARRDGTLRKPVTIWVVRLGDDLYVRSAYGRGSKWFSHVQERHEGHVSAGGVQKDVRFVESDDDINDAIDEAYRTKYRRYAAHIVDPMMTPEVRATTLRLVPS
jgi:hypothetical protein